MRLFLVSGFLSYRIVIFAKNLGLRNLIKFIIRYNFFLVFIILEGFSFFLILQYNINQREIFINTSSDFSNFVNQTGGKVKAYFNLKTENDILNHQNIHLLNFISNRKQKVKTNNNLDYLSYGGNYYSFSPGLIINNSTHWQKNLISLNKGTLDGISPNMAVIGPQGAVGVVFKCSSHFSTVVSLLNTTLKISVFLKKNNYNGTIVWNGKDYRYSTLQDIPIHIPVSVGDTIVTNGYSSIFPPGVPVGTISSVKKDKNTNFYNLTIRLFTNFRTIRHVYIIKNKFREELIKLETESRTDNEQ